MEKTVEFFKFKEKDFDDKFNREGDEVGDGVVQWNNQDSHYCGHSFPWELHFTIFNVSLVFFSLVLLYSLNLIWLTFCFRYKYSVFILKAFTLLFFSSSDSVWFNRIWIFWWIKICWEFSYFSSQVVGIHCHV